MTESAATLQARDLTIQLIKSLPQDRLPATSELPALIESFFSTVSQLGNTPGPTLVPAAPEPAVAIKSSVKPDYLVCLEDGAKLKMLKRYLRTHFDMTPDQYRAKWGLPASYPMVAPNYAATRRDLAVKIGLGRKAVATKKG